VIVTVLPERLVFRPGLILALVLTAACGYGLNGRLVSLPDHVRTIGVPPFVNQTSFPDLDLKFGEAFRTEFLRRGRFRVIPQAEGADAVLIGRVASASWAPSLLNASNQGERYTVTVSLPVEFRIAGENEVYWSDPAGTAVEQVPVSAGSTLDLGAFFQQSESSALDRMAQAFARRTVGAILEKF
jgi:hypothetical protein